MVVVSEGGSSEVRGMLNEPTSGWGLGVECPLWMELVPLFPKGGEGGMVRKEKRVDLPLYVDEELLERVEVVGGGMPGAVEGRFPSL